MRNFWLEAMNAAPELAMMISSSHILPVFEQGHSRYWPSISLHRYAIKE